MVSSLSGIRSVAFLYDSLSELTNSAKLVRMISNFFVHMGVATLMRIVVHFVKVCLCTRSGRRHTWPSSQAHPVDQFDENPCAFRQVWVLHGGAFGMQDQRHDARSKIEK